MADIAVVPRIAVEGILLEPRPGGVRVKLRGQQAVHVPWHAAAALADELAALARAAGRARP